jgi:hypothetical protein
MAFGTLKADTLTHSTAGSLATNFVVNGSAKAWVRGGNDASLTDSFNISSGTDLNTGYYRYAFSSAMGNANYSGGGFAFSGSAKYSNYETATTAHAEVNTFVDSGSKSDSTNSSQYHGDLA